jgi:hypothetical protein
VVSKPPAKPQLLNRRPRKPRRRVNPLPRGKVRRAKGSPNCSHQTRTCPARKPLENSTSTPHTPGGYCGNSATHATHATRPAKKHLLAPPPQQATPRRRTHKEPQRVSQKTQPPQITRSADSPPGTVNGWTQGERVVHSTRRRSHQANRSPAPRPSAPTTTPATVPYPPRLHH